MIISFIQNEKYSTTTNSITFNTLVLIFSVQKIFWSFQNHVIFLFLCWYKLTLICAVSFLFFLGYFERINLWKFVSRNVSAFTKLSYTFYCLSFFLLLFLNYLKFFFFSFSYLHISFFGIFDSTFIWFKSFTLSNFIYPGNTILEFISLQFSKFDLKSHFKEILISVKGIFFPYITACDMCF